MTQLSPFKTLPSIIALACICFSAGCSSAKKTTEKNSTVTANKQGELSYAIHKSNVPARKIDTKNISADKLVQFAETLIGTRYKYGSSNKDEGFDCSGFINYVFNHFDIKVPRSSIDFTNAGTAVLPGESRKGDLILFTGSDTTGWIVGHMGIITRNDKGKIKFIHSASGNNMGVMISDMSNYFITRFVKVIRIFK
ncbi:MAG: C40 family peptidase [Ferruginibacter sp.]